MLVRPIHTKRLHRILYPTVGVLLLMMSCSIWQLAAVAGG